jgi:biotin operon repressor
MNSETKRRFIATASNCILDGYVPTSAQEENIIKVWQLFQDNNWHSYYEIADLTGYSESYVNQQIMPLLKKSWGLITETRRGYKLETKQQNKLTKPV